MGLYRLRGLTTIELRSSISGVISVAGLGLRLASFPLELLLPKSADSFFQRGPELGDLLLEPGLILLRSSSSHTSNPLRRPTNKPLRGGLYRARAVRMPLIVKPCHGLPVRVGTPSLLSRAAMRSKSQALVPERLHALERFRFAFVVAERLAPFAAATPPLTLADPRCIFIGYFCE